MVSQGMNPNVEDPKTGWTPLGLAVIKESEIELIKKLVEAHADLNKQNKAGFTPLHSACSLENEQVVKVLLDFGADANIPNGSLFTPLHTALTLKNATIVRLLIRSGANPTTPFPKTGTLPSAVISKIDDPELIAEFLEHNQDVDPGIRLCTAIRSGHPKLVKYLIEEKGLNLNTEYSDSSFGDMRRPLSYTIKKNNTVDMEMITFLVSQGANPSLPLSSSSKRTLLHMALDMQHKELFKFLIDQEYIDLNAREKNQWTPLNTALGTKNVKAAQRLIERGADVNIPNDKQVYPIHQAILLDSSALLEQLLENSAEVNVQTFNKMTPLDFALREKKWKLAKLLIEKGANKLKRAVGRSSWTLMHYMAAIRGVDPYIISESLRIMTSLPMEFPIDAVDKQGWTALHLAVKNFNKEAVLVLVQAGADVTIATRKKWSPLHTLAKLSIKVVKRTKEKTSISENILRIADILIDAVKGIPVQDGIDQKGENGFTPLDIAVFNQNTSIIDKLQNNGAKSSVSNKTMGVHHAAEIGIPDMIKGCKDSPDINTGKGSSAWTPLHIAAWFGHDKAVTALIQINADPTIQDKEGRTPLHLAVTRRRRRVVRALMTANSSVANIKDKNGHSVLDDTPKSDKSLVAMIQRFTEASHKPSIRETAIRGRARAVRRDTRVAETRDIARDVATFRGQLATERGRRGGRRGGRAPPVTSRGRRGGRDRGRINMQEFPALGATEDVAEVLPVGWGEVEPGSDW
jgi:ankyrin